MTKMRIIWWKEPTSLFPKKIPFCLSHKSQLFYHILMWCLLLCYASSHSTPVKFFYFNQAYFNYVIIQSSYWAYICELHALGTKILPNLTLLSFLLWEPKWYFLPYFLGIIHKNPLNLTLLIPCIPKIILVLITP